MDINLALLWIAAGASVTVYVLTRTGLPRTGVAQRKESGGSGGDSR